MIRMNKNESPIKPIDTDTLTHIISNCDYHLYPDIAYDRFRRAYTHYYGDTWHMNQICCGNGSDELIQKLMLIMPEGPCLTLNPDFFMYQNYAQQVQRDIVFVEGTEDLTFPLDTILARIEAVQPSFFIMSNPHNPTGHRFDESALVAIADAMKACGGYFIIDEAYADFSTPAAIPLEDHILIMRTLSKAFAMAGLRLGILIGTEKTIQKVRQIEHPYPLSALTMAIGTYLFENIESTKAFVKHQRQLSNRLKAIFQKYVSDKLTIYPSETNFVLTAGSQAMSLGHYVQEKGFFPRFYHEQTETRMAGFVRYSIATDAALNQFEQAVKEWSEQDEI
ncbi:pyridoxal phosphate-dependent aminotransferase [Staphylococcus lutrae]|uniref:Putative pyridoxal phosphate-dependent acyltransferase n=1 Tax=Staphylococcus lutrae TaxID=155085 RepID=A0AAC9RVP1_9STAP|nr:histidinol-phosphate transaminase [Staphylococcus lutrae]ARJ50677.1 histidinol-phosphate aminotransferase [Staphylococcus lutrae]PNZ34725.1 histidinol-phosphate aminotransferase family protein [Staphylococcus lutrae]